MGDAAWAVAGAVLLAASVALVLAPLRVNLSVQARGDPTGAWAVAGGVRIAFVAVAVVAASGMPATASLHVFGRRLAERRLADLVSRAAGGDGEGASVDRLHAAWERFERHLDPIEVAGFLLGERRRLELVEASVDCEYSFADVALTGKVLAALCVLDGALPPRVRIHGVPSWEAVDRAAVAASASLRLWPGRALVDALVFLARNARWRRGAPPAPAPAAPRPLGGAGAR